MLRHLMLWVLWLSLAGTVTAQTTPLQAKYGQWQREFNQRVQKMRMDELRDMAAEGEKATEPDHLTLVEIYAALSNSPQVIQHAEAAVKQGSATESLYAAYVNALIVTRDSERAEQVLAKAQQAFPQSASLRPFKLRLAESAIYGLLAKDQLDEAESRLAEARELLAEMKLKFPDNTFQWSNSQRSLDGIAQRIKGTRERLALIGQPAFPLDGAVFVNGSPLSADDLKAKVVLLDFWAVWCGPCIATFPHLRKWHEEYSPQGLVIVGATQHYQFGWNENQQRPEREAGIAPEKERLAIEAFAKHHELKHALAVMPSPELSRKYLVAGIPQAVVIDRAGKIRQIRIGSGPQNAEDLEQTIRKCLAEKPPGDAAGQ